jgi:hypothetical protein
MGRASVFEVWAEGHHQSSVIWNLTTQGWAVMNKAERQGVSGQKQLMTPANENNF